MLPSASSRRSRQSGASPIAADESDASHTLLTTGKDASVSRPPISPSDALSAVDADTPMPSTARPRTRRSPRPPRVSAMAESPHSDEKRAEDTDTDDSEESEISHEQSGAPSEPEAHRSVIHCGVAAESGEDDCDGVVRARFLPYFDESVDVFFAQNDGQRRLLVRCSTLAAKLGCKTNKLAMWLSRRAGRKEFEGIYQASGFINKPAGRCGLKASSYFLTVDACRQFEAFRPQTRPGAASASPRHQRARPKSRPVPKAAPTRSRSGSRDLDDEYLPASRKRDRSQSRPAVKTEPAPKAHRAPALDAAPVDPTADDETTVPRKRQRGRREPIPVCPASPAPALEPAPQSPHPAPSTSSAHIKLERPEPLEVTRQDSAAPVVEMLMQLRADRRLSPLRSPPSQPSAPPPLGPALDLAPKVFFPQPQRPLSPVTSCSGSVRSANSLPDLVVKPPSPPTVASSPFSPLTPTAVRLVSPAHSTSSPFSASSVPPSPLSFPFRPFPSPLFAVGSGWPLPLALPQTGSLPTQPLLAPSWPQLQQASFFFPPPPSPFAVPPPQLHSQQPHARWVDLLGQPLHR